MKTTAGGALVALALLSAASEASAAETDPVAANSQAASISVASAAAVADAESYSESNSDQWEVALIPYLWASGMNADMETREGEDVDVDQSFTDILGDLKFVFMGALDARRGRFVTLNDLVYLSVSSSADGNLGPIPIEGEADLKTFVATPLVGYRVVDKGLLFLDVMAGARIASIDVDLTLSGPQQSIERNASKTNVGPVIASRSHLPFSDHWGLALYGDIGGLGVTSDISWQLMGSVTYDLSEHWRLGAGWRHFVVHQDKGDIDAKLALSGPFFSFAYRF